MLRPLACTLLALFFSPLVFAEDGPKEVANLLHGKWKITKFEDGSDANAEGPVSAMFRFNADGKSVELIVGDDKPQAGTYESDTTKTPHQITIKPPGNDRPGRGIYKIEKDVLVICIATKNELEAPREFKVGKTAGLMMFTCERVK